MTLSPGTRLGPYEILSPLGAGGMGEVYKAKDTRLGRDVAIKVLSSSIASSADHLKRFEQEARSASALSDPHIVTVHDVGVHDGIHYFASELVEGGDLRSRLGNDGMPIKKALEIAEQIASGLASAHEKGITHRDLKPENILLSRSGLAKIADFGLAKLAETPDVELSQMPTADRVETTEGVVMGTISYMSPEQAAGRKIDYRSDQFSFGLILYEMLTGKIAFRRETKGETLAAILRDEPPPVTELNPAVPVPLAWIVERCLAKDAQDRYVSTRDLAREISGVRRHLADATSSRPAQVTATPPRRQGRLPWAIAAAAVLLSIGLGWYAVRRGGGEGRALRVSVLPPVNTVGSGPINISADGRRLVFVAAGPDGRSKLYVRELDSLEARALPASDGASSPFFSPDGRSIAFFAEHKLKRIDLTGGPPQVLADAADHRGGSWGSAGEIVFSPNGGSALYRVAASGGTASPVTTLSASPREFSHRFPRFLPDGKHFIFLNRRATAPHRLALEVASIDGGKRIPLFDANSGAVFAGGRLYFLRGTTLLAQPFDPGRFTVSGEPAPLTDQVWVDPDTDGCSAFSLAADGTLAFRGGAVPPYQMTWLNREGRKLGTVGPVGVIVGMSLSPDGRQAAIYWRDLDRDRSLVQTIDLAQGAVSLISDQGSNNVFSPDGRTIVFASDLRGVFDLYRAESHGSGSPSLLLANDVWKFPESWSPDGRFVSFAQSKPGAPAGETTDIWILPIADGGKPFPFRQSSTPEMFSAFSPDGRFVAFCSEESGVQEVYVTPFPATEAKWRISSGGGSEPRWNRNGRELFYFAPSPTTGRRTLMAASVRLSARGFSSDPPRRLFDAALRDSRGASSWSYAVSPDGGRFLAVLRVGESDSSPVVLFTAPGR